MPDDYGGTFDGVVRRIYGDGSEGEQYLKFYDREGRKQLGILKNLMGYAKLEQLVRRVELSDGVVITVSSIAGVDTINIQPPAEKPIPSGEQIEEFALIETPSIDIIGSSSKGSAYALQRPVIWRGKSLAPVELPLPVGHDIGIAYRFSPDGKLIVGRTGISSQGLEWPAIWDRKALALIHSVTNLPIPPGYTGYPEYVDGMFICTTDSGNEAFGHCPNNTFGSFGLKWTSADGATNLPYGTFLDVPANRIGIIVSGCAGDGSVITGNTNSGFSGSAPGRYKPLIWVKGIDGFYNFNEITLPAEYNNGQTGGISGDGSMIAGTAWLVDPIYHTSGLSHIILWRNNGAEYAVIGVGQGRAISYDGAVVAASAANGRAAKWTTAGFVDMGDPPPIPGSAISPFGISKHGEVIVGGTNYSGFKWSGEASITLLNPLTPGNICTAYDVNVLNPDTGLDTEVSLGRRAVN